MRRAFRLAVIPILALAFGAASGTISALVASDADIVRASILFPKEDDDNAVVVTRGRITDIDYANGSVTLRHPDPLEHARGLSTTFTASEQTKLAPFSIAFENGIVVDTTSHPAGGFADIQTGAIACIHHPPETTNAVSLIEYAVRE